MKTRLPSLLCLVGAAFSFSGCQHPAGVHPPGQAATHEGVTVVSEADIGKPVNLHVGDKLTVRLESNVTTGYGWRTKERKGNSLMPVGKQPEYVPNHTPPVAVGEGGHDLFRYAAKKPGRETLGFVYARPFAPGEVAKRARFEVVVQ